MVAFESVLDLTFVQYVQKSEYLIIGVGYLFVFKSDHYYPLRNQFQSILQALFHLYEITHYMEI